MKIQWEDFLKKSEINLVSKTERYTYIFQCIDESRVLIKDNFFSMQYYLCYQDICLAETQNQDYSGTEHSALNCRCVRFFPLPIRTMLVHYRVDHRGSASRNSFDRNMGNGGVISSTERFALFCFVPPLFGHHVLGSPS